SVIPLVLFFFSSRRRHTRFSRDWSSDVCSSDLDVREWGELLKPVIDQGLLPPLGSPLGALLEVHHALDGADDREGSGGHCTLLRDRKSTRLNSSHVKISYAVFCLKKKTKTS